MGRTLIMEPTESAEPAKQPIDPAVLLQIWLSPSFPVGAFAYSHGLEFAAQQGWVRDRNSLNAWLRDLGEFGSLRNDLILLAAAWRAAKALDQVQLQSIVELAEALQPSAERHLETMQQGASFMAQVMSAWSSPQLAQVTHAGLAYPVAVAMAAAAHDVTLEASLRAYATSFVSNLCSAAIRLSLIGQSDAQRVIADLLPLLFTMALAARDATLDDLGSATWYADLASLGHETQYTRLFRS
jgi:urease accessory protein